MELNAENYFSKEANNEYMSVSLYKEFAKCEAKALAMLKGEIDQEEKNCFLEGHLFETIVAGDIDLFMIQHPEMVASRGATKGELKAVFKKPVDAANRIKEQKFITDIVDKCEKQVIMTGEISGVKIKCCADLLDVENGNIYDLKCMAKFDDIWDKQKKMFLPWYEYYGYTLQMAVYQEIARQNYGKTFETHLIAATKEDVPDIQAIHFDNTLLEIELSKFAEDVTYFDEIKKGVVPAGKCNNCDYCKSHKTITKFEEVK